MTSTSKPIVFFGTEDFSLTALTGLIEAGYSIAAVITKPDSKKGRGQRLTPPSVKALATRHNIPVWQPQKLNEVTSAITSLDEPLGVLVSYGKIIPKSIIDLFPLGIVNVHPSLLPHYRGPSPIESAIMNGDEVTGVSIMRLAPEMDAGPVYAAKQYPLSGKETRPELYHTLATIGTNLLLETLPQIIEGSLLPIPQDDESATYCHLLQKEDAQLDPSQHTAKQIERRIRAYLDFPKSKIAVSGHTLIVTKAHVTDQQKTPLDIVCQDGVFVSIDELIAPSGKRMSATEFLRGYQA
jgi:methionyl-tRNA formyltransferase